MSGSITNNISCMSILCLQLLFFSTYIDFVKIQKKAKLVVYQKNLNKLS